MNACNLDYENAENQHNQRHTCERIQFSPEFNYEVRHSPISN